jgi:hypothetical protein
MSARARGDQGPLQARAARDRESHLGQLRGYRFLAGRGPRPSATVIPAPLRYWQYDGPRPAAVGFIVLVVGLWLAAFGWIGGASAARDEAPLALGLGLLVLLLNICRLTVTDHGVSTDVAGTRTTPSRVVPLALVREVRRGAPPADWPNATRRGGRWPGRTPVAVRHLAEDGRTERVSVHWVRDPQAFATALGQKLSG